MIARLSLRHADGAAGRAGRDRRRRTGRGPGAGASRHAVAGSLLLAKQIVEIKGVKSMFAPLVRGVVEKTKDIVMQTNFMWAKDINEVAAIVRRTSMPRAARSSMRPRASTRAISPSRN